MEPDHRAATEEERSATLTWSIIFGIAAAFLLWGSLLYYVIGDKGPPDWDFSVIPDVPGESVYSTGAPVRPPGPEYVDPQHVMEPPPQAPKKEIAPK